MMIIVHLVKNLRGTSDPVISFLRGYTFSFPHTSRSLNSRKHNSDISQKLIQQSQMLRKHRYLSPQYKKTKGRFNSWRRWNNNQKATDEMMKLRNLLVLMKTPWLLLEITVTKRRFSKNWIWIMKYLLLGKETIPCKWVYKKKLNFHGSINNFKATKKRSELWSNLQLCSKR